MSKQFTATAILLLAGDGELELDDPVAAYVPGLPRWADRVTVGQLMHQTGGIPDYIELLAEQGYDDTDPTTQAQARGGLGRRAGTRLRTGHPIRVLQLQPLGLAMAMASVGEDPLKAVSYEVDATGFVVAGSVWEQVGDGAVQTTPSQLVRWADNYRTGVLGGPELRAAQLAGAVAAEPRLARRPSVPN